MREMICCGECKYHVPFEEGGEDYICVNPDSDYFTFFTGYEDDCEMQEPRE